MFHDLRDHLGWLGLIQLAIQVIQKIDAANTKRFGRCEQFGFADLAESLSSWILLYAAEPATLPPCRCHKIWLNLLGGILCEYAAGAQRFIVGVSQYT